MKIAIVGLACNFPKSKNKDIFWDNLKNKINCISDIPKERWDTNTFYSENSEEKGKMNTKRAGFIDDIELFDADFFNISSLEAENMDPQQRILLETTYSALQDSGMIIEKIKGKKGGVFIGISASDYSYISRDPEQVDIYSISGVSLSVASNRLSYFFDLKGPSLSIDTACSSSLTAIDLACKSIKNNESDFAIAGGVNIILNPMITIGFSQAQGTSPDGNCSAFSDRANGMVRAEGCGIVILKTLEKAIEDNDRIYAVIEGSAINQDGKTNGLLAPSPEGQKNVLEQAYKNSGIDILNLDFIESHGTGTNLGDPIEALALGEILGKKREKNNPLKIGAVKTNIGHLEPAAGIAGLIKTALCIYNKELVPTINYINPNPYIPFNDLNLKVQTECEKLEKDKIFAGVSSFGFGGTNAHVVLSNNFDNTSLSISKVRNEESGECDLNNEILIISAQTEKAVEDSLKKYSDFLESKTEIDLNDFCYSNNLRKELHKYRYSIGFNFKDDLLKKLSYFDKEKIVSKPRRKKKLAFVFSGMGSQQNSMGKELLNHPIFSNFIKECDILIKKYYDWSLFDEINNYNENQDIERVQPVLFAIQCGLSKLFEYYGIKASAVVGSSVGEVSCAYVSGALNLEDAIKTICIRNKAMCSMIGTGKMALIKLDENKTKDFINNRENLYISAINSKNTTIISSTENNLLELEKEAKEKDLFFRIIKGTEAPSHSVLMEPIKDFIIDNLKDIKSNETNIDFYSTVTAKKISGLEITNNYWWQNVRKPIEFYKTISEMENNGDYIYIEISPHPILISFIKEIIEEKNKNTYLFESLRREENELNSFFECLGKIYSTGFDIDFSKIYFIPEKNQTENQQGTKAPLFKKIDEHNKLVDLPEYPWQKEYFWVESKENKFLLTSQLKRKNLLENKNDILTIETILNSDDKNKSLLISDYLVKNISKVLKVPENEIDKNNQLKNLGIGSLMGMELFNRLKNDFKITLPLSKILKGPSINEITEDILVFIKEKYSNNLKININQDLEKNDKLIPLSFPQQRLWFIEQLESGIISYNIPSALKFDGYLNYEILEKSINKIIERHENLRTVFKLDNNIPHQVILSELKISLKIVEIDENTNLNEVLKEDASIPFDLKTPPLLRGTIFRKNDTENIVLLTIHHIISDGFSLKILFEEITTIYKNLLENNNIQLEKLTHQYSDFSFWQKNLIESNKLDKQIDFWKKQLFEISESLNLPFDKPRNKIQTFNGAMNNFEIPFEILNKLQELGKQKGVTVFSILLSIYNILIYKYSGQKDIIVGTPITGRNEPEWENLIGLFLNMLSLRTKIDSEISFSKLIEEVSNTTLSAYDNQDLPFEKIVEIINPERTTGRTPIFQTIIALHASIDIEPINETKITYLDVDMKTSKFDLVLSIIPFDEKLKCVFEYNTDLFFDSTIEKLKNSFLNIIDIILANNEIKIKDIDVLSENEKNKILDFSHGKKVSYDNNLDLLDIFKNQVLSYPNNTAIKDNSFNRNISITYNDLDLESNKIANFLIDKNIKNSLVSVFFERSSELIISILGILKSYNYFLPIDPKNPKKRNELIIEDSQTEIIITSKEYSNLLSDNAKYVFIEDIPDPKFLNKVASAPCTNSKTAYVIYTSGSTGIPKGVEISKQNLLNLINWHKETYELNEKTNSSLIAGVSFDASVWEIFPYIMSGSTIHIPEKNILEKTSSFTNWLEENKIDISFIPTPFFEIIKEEDWKIVKSLKKVLVGGDKLSKIPENVSFRLYNHYGPTENTVVSTYIEIPLLNKGALVPCPLISIGKPIDNVDIFILDTDLNLCPINITGEIYLTGESISKGYYKKENLNDNYFIKTDFSNKKLYKTGDLAKWNEKGEIIFIGRNNTQVKIRGVRIEIEEVENILNSHEQVKKAVVRIIEKNKNKFLVAYVLTKKEIDLTNYLIERLPDAFIPKIIYIEDFYLTTNGKIDFEALEKKYLTNEINIIEIENITPIQKVLIDIFSIFFENTNININSSFFELGGHSLLAIQTVDKISRAFNINLEIKDLFSYPNINNLSKIIELKQKNGEFKLPEIIQNNDDLYKPFPLTEIQQAYLVGRENIELGNISAHGYIEIEIKDLDIDKFEKAFNKVIARHYLLKTVIENDKQVILKNIPYFKIKTHKINSNNSDINNINEILEIRKRLSHEKIDYSKFPVFNLEISVLNEEISILHYSFDAIFTDATSIIIIAKEITDFYNNTNLELQNLEINFRDYVLYCEKLKDSFLYNKSKNYWLDRLDNLPSAPQLYTNISKINENINRTKFNRLEGKLSKDKWDKIKFKAKNLNITVNTILITSFSKILSYWSKKSDFTLNITLFNRLQVHRDINNILGDFTSLNLLEINLDNSKNFYENSINIQKQLIEDIDNRYFGGVSVLRELARLKGLEASFMPVVFTSMVGNNGFDFNSLLGKIVYSITQTPQVWLDHQVTEINEELVFNWDYLEHIFPEKMIKAMFEAYCKLLEEISEQNLDNYFNISDKKQIDFINLDFNNTYKKLDDKLLHEGFFEQVEKNPNKIAIISDNEEFSYNDIFKLVKNTAYKIQNSKKDDSKFIGVYLDKSYKQVVAVLSILYLGYAYIPLNIDYPKDRNDFIINTCNIKTIISDINYDNNFNIVKIDKNDNFIEFKNEIKLNSDETAYIIFTSGSTGIPKGVEISHKGAVNTILDINERFNITSDDSVFALSSLSFDLSVYDIFGTFFAGGTIVIPSNEELNEPSFWENLLIKNKVTIWNSVPALMNMYAEYCNDKKERFSPYLKTVMMSGDWIPLDLPNKIKAFDNKIKVISLGGATEASIWSIFYEIESFNNNWNSIPYGKPLSNQKMYVLNDILEICPEYIDGYIYIGGEGLAKSYYNDEEKTNKSFIIHPQTKERLYKTGDLGRFLPEGYIEFLGREDHQVKINGYRIEIGEIETLLIKHEKISNVIVITSKDKYNKKLIAYLEIKENLDDSEIISYLSKKLPEYMIPKIFIKLEKFPLSDNGKIDRKQLPDYINDLNKENIVIDSKLSNKILKIIKEVLSIQEIYNDTDLLSIGANSIDIVKIANRLEVEFGFCPKISDIFRLKTVTLISDFYEKRKDEIKETFEYKEGQIIIDSEEREKFKNNRLSIRKLSGIETKLDSYDNNDNYNNYKTTRFFSDEIINKKDFGNFLGVLREIELNSSFKYLYPSAGSLYPVQIYILIKENAIQDFSSGIYYYNPKNHSLIKIIDEVPENIHFSSSLNIYNSSKFSIFLISDLRAIEPLYSTTSIEYSYIEAGSITQLLRSESYKYNIGLCSIGQVNVDNLKKVLNLDDKYLFLHTILGGIISDDNKVISNDEDDEWEEIVI